MDDSPDPSSSTRVYHLHSPYLPEAPLPSDGSHENLLFGLTCSVNEHIDSAYFNRLSSISKPMDFTGNHPNLASERVDSCHAGPSTSDIDQLHITEPSSVFSDHFSILILDNPPGPPSGLSPWHHLGPTPPPNYNTNSSIQHWNDPSATSAVSESPPRPNGGGASSGRPLRGSERDPHHDSKHIVHRVLVDSRTRGEADRRIRELARDSQNTHCLEEFEAASHRRLMISQRGLEKSNNRRKTERRFSCILCTATVTTNANLQNHYRSHLIFNEFPCEWCKRYFRTSSILNKHQNEAQQCLALHSIGQGTKQNSRS